MRALFLDTAFSYHTGIEDISRIDAVTPPTDSTAMRDLWIRVEAIVGDPYLTRDFYVYPTRALAYVGGETEERSDEYIASKTGVEMPADTVTLDDNAANGPDMTGLTLDLGITSNPGFTDMVGLWGYVATPDLVVCENVETLLQAHMADGKALENFDSNLSTTIGNDAGFDVATQPHISIWSDPVRIIGSLATNQTEQHIYPTNVAVSVVNVNGPWRSCREYMAAIASILGDENRTSYSETLELRLVRWDGPLLDEDNPSHAVGFLTFDAEFHAMWQDD